MGSGHAGTAFAEVDAREVLQKGTKELGLLVGYWQANGLFADPPSTNRSAIFFLPKWGRIFTDELKAKWFSGNAEFFIEPLAAHFFEPFSASAFGATFNLKYNFLSFGRWIPYWDGGGGLLWTDLAPRIPEQSTQWNFILQTGPGLHYLVTEKLALTLSARFNHISNANAGERNTGINAWMFNAGFSFFLP
ncbi:MAG: acyloxyacyl hydrolase [Nitrospirales bacterium]|nr:acyloxyacyl hydrolase [Nitrospirales bacterium]